MIAKSEPLASEVSPTPQLAVMPSSLADLQTEQNNSKTRDIDTIDTIQLCREGFNIVKSVDRYSKLISL